MELLDRATGLLRRTEAELRKILSDAATAGDYASVVQVTTWARSLSEMVDGLSPRTGKSAQEPRVPSSARRELRPSRNTRTVSSATNGGSPTVFRPSDGFVPGAV